MKEIDYSDFIKRRDKAEQRKPLHGQIELTYNCNYNCIHCYSKNQSRKKLDFSFWKNIINQVHDSGGMELTFTGGDPLLHEDFLKVYQHAKKKGFLINIFTNGFNLNKEILDFLEDYPPLSIEITINSLNKKNYERITRAKGAFEKVMKYIDEIKNRNLPLVLKCNGLKENKGEILKIKEFSESLLGKKKFKFDSFVFAGLNQEEEPKKHRLTANEIRKIVSRDKDMLEENRKQLEDQQDFLNPAGLYHCTSWLTNYFINPQGILKFCHLSKKYSTDLKKELFTAGFDKFLNILKEKYKVDSICISCKYKEYCYHCPARAYLETGSEEAPVEYYCGLAEARKKSMDGLRLIRNTQIATDKDKD